MTKTKRVCNSCGIVEDQLRMHERIDGNYRNWFCESCWLKIRKACTFGFLMPFQNQNQSSQRTITDFNSSCDSSQQSQIIKLIGENQELRGDILRLEKKIDQLQQQINQLIEQQQTSQN